MLQFVLSRGKVKSDELLTIHFRNKTSSKIDMDIRALHIRPPRKVVSNRRPRLFVNSRTYPTDSSKEDRTTGRSFPLSLLALYFTSLKVVSLTVREKRVRTTRNVYPSPSVVLSCLFSCHLFINSKTRPRLYLTYTLELVQCGQRSRYFQ